MKQTIILLALIATAFAEACPKDEYCASCEGAVCQKCVNAYLSNGICVKVEDDIDDCYEYENATTCRNCDSGHYLSGGKCREIEIDNCVEVLGTAATQCITCDNGKLPLNGSCKDGPQCGLDNCDVCRYANGTSGAAICVTCKNNFSVTSTGVCIAEPTDNCLAATNATTCALCYRGYYDDGTTCKSTTVQGSGVQIFATLASVIALVLFL